MFYEKIRYELTHEEVSLARVKDIHAIDIL